MWTSEWIATAYFAYLSAVCWMLPIAMRRRFAIVAAAALEILAIAYVARQGNLLLRQVAPMATILRSTAIAG